MKQVIIIILTLCTCFCVKAQERIYIQTDRNKYITGDTVWLRAHLMDAATNLPTTNKRYPKNRSKFIYIELHDIIRDQLIERIMIKEDEDGVFSNALPLSKKLQEGQYLLVAYTRHMLNYPSSLWAYKRIFIY